MATSTPALPGRVFISYRRGDTAFPASWLFDRLAERFGRDQVFKDVDSIELGDDFVEVITAAVGSCDVLLVVIGDRWLTSTDKDGRRRLDDPSDFVRLEVEAALIRNVRIIPILVDGAQMPSADDLPSSIGLLARRQALELSPSRFEFDTSRLMRVLDRTLMEVRGPATGGTSQRRPVAETQSRAGSDDKEPSQDREQGRAGHLSGSSPAGSAPPVARRAPIPAESPGPSQRPHSTPTGTTPVSVAPTEAGRFTRPGVRRRVLWTRRSVAVAAGVGVSILAIVILKPGGPPQHKTTPPSSPSSSSSTPTATSPSTPTATSPSFTYIVGLLPAQFRGSCQSKPADVNTAVGQAAIAACTISGVQVVYSAYTSQAHLSDGLNALGGGNTSSGPCEPQGNDGSIINNTQPFNFGGHPGTVFCDYGNNVVNSIIGWTDQYLPLVLGVIIAPPRESYEQLWGDWKNVLAAE